MLAWFEADGTTPLGSIALGAIGPGESYAAKHTGVAKQVVLKNTGAVKIESVTVAITQVAAYPANEYALIATGSTQPAGGSFANHTAPLAIVDLNPTDTANVWIDASVPISAARQMAQMVTLHASGTEA